MRAEPWAAAVGVSVVAARASAIRLCFVLAACGMSSGWLVRLGLLTAGGGKTKMLRTVF